MRVCRPAICLPNGPARYGSICNEYNQRTAGAMAHRRRPKGAGSMVRIGVIGAGPNGAGHCRKFTEQHGTRCSITAIADVNEDAGRALAQQYDAQPVTTLDALFDKADAIVISSPNFLHRDHGVAAARAGKHVWVEKPMALSVAEADDIVAAVDESGVKSFVGFSVRFSGIPRTMKQFYQEGRLGDLLTIWSRRVAGFGNGRAKSWRGSFAKSGGVMSELIAHEIDWMLDITGMPKAVYCRTTSRLRDDPRANDHVWMTFSYDGSFNGTIEGSQMAPIADYYKGIAGTTASTFDREWGQKLILQTGKNTAEEPEPLPTFDKHGHFLDVIEDRCESVAPVHWGRRIVALTERALESAVTAKVVSTEGI
ncbi:MAG: hypothetical protein GF331_07990 [Chitinivibrionales bacterium]|nr:hypothetical protein [Chitinivibrionales bacterium]